MKKLLAFFLFAAVAFAACGDSDEEGGAEPTPEREATVLPVVKYYSQTEFLAQFVGSTWSVTEAYDVFADGKTGEEILHNLVGAVPFSFRAVNESTGIVHLIYTDPRMADVEEEVGYSFQDGNILTFAENVHIEGYLAHPLTVLEINDSVLRCLGQVFSHQWAPDAVNGLYVFRKK